MVASLLDGDDGTLSMTLGLGNSLSHTYSLGRSSFILGKQIAEPSLYVNAGTFTNVAVARSPVAAQPEIHGGGGSGDNGDSGP